MSDPIHDPSAVNQTVRAKVLGDRTVAVEPPSLKAENRPWCLLVVGGAMIGRHFDLGDAARIGREGDVEIRLPEASVSRRHAHIFRKRGAYWVTDLGATNPVRVNDVQVKEGPLLEGDMLTVGDVVLRLLGPDSPENAMVAALHEQASRDALTGIANRRHFRTAMDSAFAASRDGGELALIALDVDHFKHINARYGHPVGDRVLTAVGALLRTHARAGDTPGRIGGEEFAVVLPATGREAAIAVAESLRKALEALHIGEAGERVPVTASFGVAVARGEDDTADALYVRADAALYEAKRAGRNRVEFGSSEGAAG
ncbi:MAG TPA: GGDEF domain-containing protein [Xanthomonadaceae bacterium]|nr:GGDEF domain-containing protein [Xanthomonadaceae bacterium]